LINVSLQTSGTKQIRCVEQKEISSAFFLKRFYFLPILSVFLFALANVASAQTADNSNNDQPVSNASALPPVVVDTPTDRTKRNSHRRAERSSRVKPVSDATDNGVTVLQPIIVTARKTDEDLSKVPESLTVVSRDILQSMPLQPVQAAAQNSPNLHWTNWGASGSFLSIRGVSSLGTPVNNADGTISFNIDGVPGSMLSLSNNLLDVQRVEVLRGPQGTLWGASALGGAINVITNQPDGTRDIHVTTEFGSNGYRMGEAVVGGNIIPNTLDGRMAVRFGNYDGDIKSLHTDGDLGARDIQAFRGGLRFTGSDGTTATLTGSYSHDRGNSPFFLLGDAPGFPVSGTLTEPRQDSKQSSLTLNIQHEFDNFLFTSITGYQRNKIDGYVDSTDSLVYDHLGIPPAFQVSQPGITNDAESIYSQEFRLNSLADSPYRWVVGASVGYTDAGRDATLTDAMLTAVPGAIATTSLKTLNTGIFGDVSIPLTDKLSLSLGGRFSYDDLRIRVRNSENLAALSGRNSATESYFTGRAALSYQWTDNAMTYVSVARGHSTRIFPLYNTPVAGVVADAYPAATGLTYEAGAKFKFFDDRLQLDGSVFYNDIKNGVLTYLDPTNTRFLMSYENYDTTGFELQARAQIVEGLNIVGGMGYTHAELGSGSTGASFEGRRVPNIPSWSANAGLQYLAPVNALGLPGQFSASAELQYVSSRAVDVQGSFDLRPYSIVNLRAGWKDAGGDFEVYGFARNLFDKRYEVYGASLLGAPVVMTGTGRIVGFGATKHF